jgi:hypothetical protein
MGKNRILRTLAGVMSVETLVAVLVDLIEYNRDRIWWTSTSGCFSRSEFTHPATQDEHARLANDMRLRRAPVATAGRLSEANPNVNI